MRDRPADPDPPYPYGWPQGADFYAVEDLAATILAVAEKLPQDGEARLVVYDSMAEGQSVVDCDGPEDTDWQAVADAIFAAAWPNHPTCGGELVLKADGTIELELAFPAGSDEYSPICWERPVPDEMHDDIEKALDRAGAASAEVVVTDRPIGGLPRADGELFVRVTLYGAADGRDFPGWPSRPEKGIDGLGIPIKDAPPGSVAALAYQLVTATDDPFSGHPELRTRILVHRPGANSAGLAVALDNPSGSQPALCWSLPPPGAPEPESD